MTMMMMMGVVIQGLAAGNNAGSSAKLNSVTGMTGRPSTIHIPISVTGAGMTRTMTMAEIPG
jgi:hypothetical protein